MPAALLQINGLKEISSYVCYSSRYYNVNLGMRIDPYLIDILMRDLVAHSRSSSAFLVYLQLYRLTHGAGRDSTAISHAVLSELTGLSKRSIQTAIAHLVTRRLIKQRKSRPTSVPVYEVLTPWVRNVIRKT